MQYFRPPGNCRNCYTVIDPSVPTYSIFKLDYQLCISCQNELNPKFLNSTEETVRLYFSLKDRGVPAELEKFDGYKIIDIAVVQAGVNIEVEEKHHNNQREEVITDLQSTFCSFLNGYMILRIPKALILQHLEKIADIVTEFLHEKFLQKGGSFA